LNDDLLHAFTCQDISCQNLKCINSIDNAVAYMCTSPIVFSDKKQTKVAKEKIETADRILCAFGIFFAFINSHVCRPK